MNRLEALKNVEIAKLELTRAELELEGIELKLQIAATKRERDNWCNLAQAAAKVLKYR